MKHILITGGSRGIGEACVRAFAAEGNRVAFFYHRAESEPLAARICAETGALSFRVDASNAAAVDAAVKQLLQLWDGRIDVLVNNAGIAQIKLFTELTDEDWRRMLAVNLDAAFYLSRAVAPVMIRQQSGSIVNIGSMWGKCGASCEVHYSASKAALRGMTMALAKELGPSGITVNCVEPGVIETDMNAALEDDTRASLAAATPLCRLGHPEEVAAAVCFLASATFITGQILGVDGGFAV